MKNRILKIKLRRLAILLAVLPSPYLAQASEQPAQNAPSEEEQQDATTVSLEERPGEKRDDISTQNECTNFWVDYVSGINH